MTLSGPITLIKRSWKIFFDKKNMPIFVKIYLPLLPFALFSIWQENYVTSYDDIKNLGLLGVVIVVNLTYLVMYLWLYIAGVIAIKKRTNNESVDIKETYNSSWMLLWKFSVLSLVVTLAQLGGGLLLIIPGIIFSVWYSFSKFIYIDGENKVLNAMGRSRYLVKGKFLPVLGRSFVFILFSGAFGIILTVIPWGLGGIISTLFGALFVLPFYLLYRELLVLDKN